jgi:hypothetical protein
MTHGLRSKSLTTKVTEPEYERIVQMAGTSNRNVSEWMRECLFREIGRSISSAEHEILLAEILAMRAIILNLSFWMISGQKLTEQEVLNLIRLSDQDKSQKARQRLNEAGELTDEKHDQTN